MLDNEAFNLMNDLKDHQESLSCDVNHDEALDDIGGMSEIHGDLSLIGCDVLSDLEFENTYTGETSSSRMTVIGRLDSCMLLGGSRVFTTILLNPISDVETLNKRKACLKDLELTDDLATMMLQMRESEQDVLWMYRRTLNELDSLYDMVYFTSLPLTPLNHSPAVLTAYNVYRIAVSPAIGCLSPITMIVMPYLILRSLGLNIPVTAFLRILMSVTFTTSGSSYGYVSLAFTVYMYFQNIFNSLELAKTSYTISNIVTSRMNSVVTFIRNAHAINVKLWNNSMYSFIDNLTPGLNNTTYANTIVNSFSIMNNFGEQLNKFKTFKKDVHRDLIKTMYLMDALCCMKRIATMPGYCFAEYKEASSPGLSLKQVFHPCIEHPILNSITLGSNEPNNIILTSPNGSGKSVLIKSILISIMLAQSITATCASSCSITPFFHLSSQINIPDCKGKESLFEAEMSRSKRHLDTIRKLKDEQFSFICTDEMFNSTSAIEGVAAAYAVLEKMADNSNCLNIVSTHYLYLTKLTAEKPRSFANYKIDCRRRKDGTITYPYILTPGVSKQHIALDLLLQNGFDSELVNSAKAIVQKLTTRKTPDTDEFTFQFKKEV